MPTPELASQLAGHVPEYVAPQYDGEPDDHFRLRETSGTWSLDVDHPESDGLRARLNVTVTDIGPADAGTLELIRGISITGRLAVRALDGSLAAPGKRVALKAFGDGGAR